MIAALAGMLANPLGRALVMLLAAGTLAGGLYLKGRADARALCRLQGERDVLETIERAQAARDRAVRRDADDGRLRDDDAFRRD